MAATGRCGGYWLVWLILAGMAAYGWCGGYWQFRNSTTNIEGYFRFSKILIF